MATQFDFVYAVPGEQSIIDVVRQDGLSGVYGETLDELRLRYPNAVRMAWADWQAQAVARQQTPILWEPSTAEKYNEMLEVLPPLAWSRGAFLVGEAYDHDIATGRARYQAYRQVGPRYFASSRPLTILELRAELDKPIASI